ncbi:MAG TPA: plasmid stabilization protein [Alphaproteobacteria bacterium]|nr:plasmid stabilization protein [Alphaproteobacteria bacterium]
MLIKIYPPARSRIKEIWQYTKNLHGQKQADIYIRGLGETINGLYDNRPLWRQIEDSELNGIFFTRYEHHYIFFRELSGSIGIINILHEKMDIPSRLKNND